MIFPTEELYALRRSLIAQANAGELTQDEAFRRALAADPEDSSALRYLGMEAEKAGNLDEAMRYARETIRTHPNGYDGYLLLARLLRSDVHRSCAYGELGLENMLFDSEAVEQHVDRDRLKELSEDPARLESASNEELLIAVTATLRRQRIGEPPEVTHELEPHRLIHELREKRDDLLDRETVERILARAEDCAPLLLGILKEFGEDLLADEDYSIVERSLALLGEIGYPSFLPVLTEFLVLQEDDVSGPADWAFRRIGFQNPAAVLDFVRAQAPAATASEIVALAEQITLMPDAPGRMDVLRGLLSGVDRVPDAERGEVISAIIAGAIFIEGRDSPFADELERRNVSVMTRKLREELRQMREHVAELGTQAAEPDDVTIFDICCEEPEHDHEHEHDSKPQPIVNEEPKLGRNEPCWCGSGKKYKKCHLDADEGR